MFTFLLIFYSIFVCKANPLNIFVNSATTNSQLDGLTPFTALNSLKGALPLIRKAENGSTLKIIIVDRATPYYVEDYFKFVNIAVEVTFMKESVSLYSILFQQGGLIELVNSTLRIVSCNMVQGQLASQEESFFKIRMGSRLEIEKSRISDIFTSDTGVFRIQDNSTLLINDTMIGDLVVTTFPFFSITAGSSFYFLLCNLVRVFVQNEPFIYSAESSLTLTQVNFNNSWVNSVSNNILCLLLANNSTVILSKLQFNACLMQNSLIAKLQNLRENSSISEIFMAGSIGINMDSIFLVIYKGSFLKLSKILISDSISTSSFISISFVMNVSLEEVVFLRDYAFSMISISLSMQSKLDGIICEGNNFNSDHKMISNYVSKQGPCISVINFNVVFVKNVTIKKCRSLDLIPGISLINYESFDNRSTSQAIINLFTCDSNTAVNERNEFFFQSTVTSKEKMAGCCLDLDTGGQVGIVEMYASDCSIINQNLEKPAVGNPCIFSRDRDSYLTVRSSIFRRTKADVESFCLKFTGTGIIMENSTFEGITKLDESRYYEENRGGALHFGTGSIYLYNIYISGCQAYQGAAFFFQNDIQRDNLTLIGINIYIGKNKGFQGTVMILDHSLSEGHYVFENITVSDNLAEHLSIIVTLYTFPFHISFYNCLFERNFGYYRGGVMSLLNTAGNTTFSSCKFLSNNVFHTGNSHGGVFFLYSSYRSVLKTLNCLFFNNTSTATVSYGGVLSCFGGDYFDFGSKFIKNLAWMFASQIFLSSDTTIGFTESIYDGLNETYNISLIFLFQLGHVTIKNVIFKDFNILNGGAVRLEGLIDISMEEVILQNFNSKSEGILEFSENSKGNVMLTNLQLFECEAQDSLFIFKAVQANLRNILVTQSKAGKVFNMQSGVITWNKGVLTNHECLSESDCLGLVIENSLVLLKNIMFSDFRHKTKEGETLLNIKESQVFINFSTFSIFSSTFLTTSSQKKVDCILVVAIATELLIENSAFSSINYALLLAQESSVNLSSNVFDKIVTFSTETRVLNINSGASIFIEWSNFTNISGGVLSLLNVQSKSSVIELSYFFNCSAEFGGAVYMQNSFLIVKKSKFEMNSAAIAGGAIFLNSEKLTTRNLLKLMNNIFERNNAHQGGALHCLAWLPENLLSNDFINNTALYGPDIGTFPLKLVLSQEEQHYCGDMSNINNLLDSNINIICEISNITSGIFTPSFELRVFDVLGQEMKLESGLGWIEIPQQTNPTSTYYVKGTSNVRITQGKINFNGLIVVAKPKSSQYLLIKTNLITQYFSELLPNSTEMSPHVQDGVGEYAYIIKINMRACGRGEIFLREQNICHKCAFGKYSFNPEDLTCKVCPENVNCEGGASFKLNEGFWRSHLNSSDVFKCSSLTGSCLGGENSKCSEGYEGFLCSVCIKSINGTYFKKNINFCEPCSNWYIYFFIIMVLAFLLFLFLGLVIYQQKTESKSTYVLMKILTNHIQTLSLITNMQFPIPNILKDFYVIQTVLVNATSFLYILSCLEDFREISVFSIGLFASIGLVLVLIIFVALFWFALGWRKNLPAKEVRAKRVNSFVILGYMFQPQFINFYIQNLTCDTYEGKTILSFNRDQECWDSTHSLLSFIITIPFLSIWMLAFPLGFMVIFYRYRNQLSMLKERTYAHYFLFGYKDRYFYWEFILILRKYSVILITTFWRTDQVFCLYIIIPILVCFISLQIIVRPFSAKRDNNLEISSLVIGFTCYFSAVFFSLDLSYSFQIFLIGLVLILNFLFLGTWIYFYVKEIKSHMKQVLDAFNNILRTIKRARPMTYFDSSRKNMSHNILSQKENTTRSKDNVTNINDTKFDASDSGIMNFSERNISRKALKFGTVAVTQGRSSDY